MKDLVRVRARRLFGTDWFHGVCQQDMKNANYTERSLHSLEDQVGSSTPWWSQEMERLVEPVSEQWLSLGSYLVARSGLPLGLQKWLRHLGRRLSHSLTMWPWERYYTFSLSLCLHFLIYKIEMVMVSVSRETIIVVRLKYENSC